MSTSLVNETENIQQTFCEKDKALCLVLAISYFFIALVAVVGNALVLYVSVRHRNYGPLKHFDCVIQRFYNVDFRFSKSLLHYMFTIYYIVYFTINILFIYYVLHSLN